MYEVVLVDSGERTREEIGAMLRGGGCRVLDCAQWRQARLSMADRHIDAVVLCDWRRGGGRGAYRYLRGPSHNAPFILISDSSRRGAKHGFAATLAYPVGAETLMQALREACEVEETVLRLGEYTLDVQRRILRHAAGGVHLTPVESELLRVLISAHGEYVESRQLVEEAWGISALLDKRVLYTHIAWLRRKLTDAFEDEDLVMSERKRGYRFSPGRR